MPSVQNLTDQYYCEVLLTDLPKEEFDKIHFEIVIELFLHISDDVSEICDHLTSRTWCQKRVLPKLRTKPSFKR